MHSPVSLSIMHIYFVQMAPPVRWINCQFSFVAVGGCCESWGELWELGANPDQNKDQNSCAFLLCLSPCWQETSRLPSFTREKSSFKSFGWRLQNELKWLSQTFPVKTHRIFLWITFTTLMVIWIFFFSLPMVKVHLVTHFALLRKITSTSFFFFF